MQTVRKKGKEKEPTGQEDEAKGKEEEEEEEESGKKISILYSAISTSHNKLQKNSSFALNDCATFSTSISLVLLLNSSPIHPTLPLISNSFGIESWKSEKSEAKNKKMPNAKNKANTTQQKW